MSKTSILFCASEVYPFAKTGGLADVAHALPRALSKEYDIQVVLPLYSSINTQKYSIKERSSFCLTLGSMEYAVEFLATEFEGIEYIFVASDPLTHKECLYGTPTEGYSDNALRFSIFNHAVVELLKRDSYSIVHCNDWQSALVPLLIKEEPEIKSKTLFTIHNLAYQGIFSYEDYKFLGLDEKYFSMEALEFYGQINFLKAGIAFADKITTVSPNYAKEILTAEFGCGLEGFLKHHSQKLSGILNGLDLEHFSPATDTLIKKTYTNLTEKKENKKAYLQESGLGGFNKPLFAFIGRLTEQKGIELLCSAIEKLADFSCNIVILGDGAQKYSDAIKEIAQQHKNIHFEYTYNEALSHRIYASCDFLLMPSLFEPCGLNQLISMSYGSLPIVHKVGGLKDSVSDYKQFKSSSKNSYGILFKDASLDNFMQAIEEGLILYEKKRVYNSLVKHNMQVDFSWKKSAQKYAKIYKELLGEPHA
ncbi:MAG: glycogen synthase [Campylobacterales bacterium]|nr:glycogen synthase [Campylobacterales bacterium]